MRVWVTRTEPGCTRQASALEAAGYAVLAAPVLGVEATGASAPAGPFRHVFFLSEQTVSAVGDLSFCAGAEIHTVGLQTRRALAAVGIRADVPDLSSSEGLIALAESLPVSGARCLIVAGEGGRKALRDYLAGAGAVVSEYLCYRRVALDVPADELSGISHALVASQDGFRAMARLWCKSGGDADIRVIAASDRIAALGPELGFENLQVAAGAGDADFIAALEAE